jgi:hypothetical protein
MTVMMSVIGLLLACGGLIVMFWLGYIVGAGRCAADVRAAREEAAARLATLGDDAGADEHTVQPPVGPPRRTRTRSQRPSAEDAHTEVTSGVRPGGGVGAV